MNITAFAPSNIALIKYMGKSDPTLNLPANGSLSMTLDHLRTVADFSLVDGPTHWVPEKPQLDYLDFKDQQQRELLVPKLSQDGISRILKHVERVRKQLHEIVSGAKVDLSRQFEIRTANTFPASVGIASSASSFAAITLAATKSFFVDLLEFERMWKSDPEFKLKLARLSRQGSGSSCRSFDGPFVLWEEETAKVIDSHLPKLSDLVVIVTSQAKQVSSSEAHLKVLSSPLWQNRPERVSARLSLLKAALISNDLTTVSRVSWQECWEMHSLFHTSSEPFTYFEPGTIEVLRWIAPSVSVNENQVLPSEIPPPIVTLDAGPNVHILVPTENAEVWVKRLRNQFPQFGILQDTQGNGGGFL